MALESGQAIRLARKLRDLRESEWPEEELTQAQLAKALSADGRVAPATVSSWESASTPKTPTTARLTAYARFFATPRSLEGGPHLIPIKDLKADELERFRELDAELLGLLTSAERQSTFAFDDGPVTIICPEAPEASRGELAKESNANYTKLLRYADQDALIELWGHVRAENPELEVRHCLPTEVTADDFSSHVILIGGTGWNRVMRRFLTTLAQVPIAQVEDEKVPTGEIFRVKDENGAVRKFYPEWDELPDGGQDLIEDVALVARLPNPFKVSRTLTICNGVHSRGVLGAVRCLTDRRVREANEKYLSGRFPDGTFAMLVRVPVLDLEALSPDLQNPNTRLYEWPAPVGKHG